MRLFGFSLAILALSVLQAFGAVGDQWIIGIHQINESQGFTTFPGKGYSGPLSSGDPSFIGNSYSHSGSAGDISRVIWELSGNAIVNGQAVGNPVPTTTQLYRVEFYGTTEPGHDDWQPVESQFHGIVGEGYPYEPSIPWAGQFGTNHQYIAANGADDGQWHVLGPGPQADGNSPADGTMMWLTAGSWLYAKWDFGFGTIDRSWSALRLTQITPVASAPVPYDYNGNGTVDAADYALWRKTESDDFLGPGYAADGNHDGYVDDLDYNNWRTAFGKTAGSGVSVDAVPEPPTFSLVAIIAVVCLAACGRRRGLVGG